MHCERPTAAACARDRSYQSADRSISMHAMHHACTCACTMHAQGPRPMLVRSSQLDGRGALRRARLSYVVARSRLRGASLCVVERVFLR
jgi:hypothetical protein